MTVEDPNRNANVVNIPSSENVTFFLQSTLSIVPGLGNNCSPFLTNPPIDRGCVGLPYIHNPGAIDPEGDSLVYSLAESIGNEGFEIDGYVFPNLVPGCESGSLTINPQNGTLIWDSPACQGEFNVAILIEEYRNGVKVGSVLRDMQIDIVVDCENDPPVIELNKTVCALAGDTINEPVLAYDINPEDIIELTGTGSPLNLDFKPAFFTNVAGSDSITSNFFWETDCQHVISSSYFMNYRAEDNNPTIQLVDFETMSINIIAPAIDSIDIIALGGEIDLTWEVPTCTNASCYKIYRRIDSSGYVPSDCETGVPASAGYEQISEINDFSTQFFADTSNQLVNGQKYCYIITSCFEDGSESQASKEICTQLKRDVAIITNVSIFVTDTINGKDTVRWTNPTELDTTTATAPYQYNVFRSSGFNNANTLVHTIPSFNDFSLADTVFIDSLINTTENAYSYEVQLVSNGNTVGNSSLASSIYLSSSPTDQQLNLSWNENTPWTNTKYAVYERDDLGNFVFIDTAYSNSYAQTGLVNGKEYCYYVKSFGAYSEDDLPSPLINLSQIHCNIPFDNVPPCAPTLTGESDCILGENVFVWNNPNNTCSDDVLSYNLYFSPTTTQELVKIDSTALNPNDTVYFYKDSISIAGCYAVTALDSNKNESPISDTICFDNCPEYRLPNVFTPGKDGFNDFFGPFPYRQVESIRLTIYNRWGEIVFKSNNPDIMWDGKHQKSNFACTAGVYYYTCDVFTIRLSGLEKIQLKGTISLINEKTILPQF